MSQLQWVIDVQDIERKPEGIKVELPKKNQMIKVEDDTCTSKEFL